LALACCFDDPPGHLFGRQRGRGRAVGSGPLGGEVDQGQQLLYWPQSVPYGVAAHDEPRVLSQALVRLGVRDLAGALAVVLIVVEVLCCVLGDEDLSRRLAEILGAWRGTRRRPAGQPGKAAGRQRRTAAAGSGPSALPGGSPPTG
jgi:hypothetical protein